MFIYFWERERVTERGRQNLKQTPGSELSAQSLTQGRTQTHKSWDHDMSWSRILNQLSHPGTLEVPVKGLKVEFQENTHIYIFLIDISTFCIYRNESGILVLYLQKSLSRNMRKDLLCITTEPCYLLYRKINILEELIQFKYVYVDHEIDKFTLGRTWISSIFHLYLK